ncbi:hypothetical protein HDK90DRAFT_408808 [Phyllosticta capitalensis]|uniref:Hypervirulence associated protein TUDOR domain-containing protein n=1 Tax=Phyllosticta capitalensis TaxID=121624 RepID=A0ABR1Z0T4_9PEZI
MPSQDKYTDPELREQVKEEIKEGDKGGAPGQWSARKAQMMASEYKKRGGDYTTSKDDQEQSQKNLSKWTDEEWQTKEGSGHAKQADGTEKRYLPKKAWEEMSEGEKEETEKAKQEGGKQGEQYVGNTKKAKESRKKASEDAKEEDQDEVSGSGEESDVNDDSEQEDGTASEGSQEPQSDEEDKQTTGKKRGRPRKSDSGAKDRDTVGSKHDDAEPPAEQGSKDRLPKEGQQVHWKALPGYVEGEVVEIVEEEKEVEGKHVKGSKGDPRIVLRSNSTGKICVHKPDAVFFD